MSTVLPISWWGSIAYFRELAAHSAVELEVWEHFPKQTHRNRLHYVTPQGLQPLTLPIVKANGSKTSVKAIELVDDKTGRIKSWRAIVSAYASSPFFDHYEKELSEFFLNPKSTLVEHTTEITCFLLNTWGIDTRLSQNTSFSGAKNLETDFYALTDGIESYTQVQFTPEQPFYPNVSALDLLCCLGPLGRNVLLR